ncbi:MAG: SDR family NAD(P)-dependent oxidoreductase [Candidatus Lokiarchaeota archaeon]|nr:SDR family NAD(P)-dependent oxidoreductase [Candidatus Lokiarchaeota archaeon]
MENTNLNGKTVIVTGANRGLGKAITHNLAKMGAFVYMVCRDPVMGKEVEKEFLEDNLNVKLKITDLEKIEDIGNLYNEIASEKDYIDILINNAGVNLEEPDTRIDNLDMNILQRTMDINFRGLLYTCQKFLNLLIKAPEARIINFSSGLGQLTVPRMGYYPAYSISKTAVNALTKNLAFELKDTNVSVFSVDPGWVKTRLGGPEAPLEIKEGIDTTIFLSTERIANLQSGEFYKERKILGW